MALEATIGGSGALFVGEDKTISMELIDESSLPVNMAAMEILLDVRKEDNSASTIFSKTATIVGVYNAARSVNTQRAEVTFTDTELNTVSARNYRHSWKRMDDGSETVLAYGDFTVQKATAP